MGYSSALVVSVRMSVTIVSHPVAKSHIQRFKWYVYYLHVCRESFTWDLNQAGVLCGCFVMHITLNIIIICSLSVMGWLCARIWIMHALNSTFWIVCAVSAVVQPCIYRCDMGKERRLLSAFFVIRGTVAAFDWSDNLLNISTVLAIRLVWTSC